MIGEYHIAHVSDFDDSLHCGNLARMIQFPYPPSRPDPLMSRPVEQAISFCLVYLLFLSLVLLALPQKLMRRVIQIAFHLRSRSRIDGEIR
jgi:hypothetical protein